MPVDIPDPATLAARDDVGERIAHGARVRHGVQDAPGVLGLEFLVRQSAHELCVPVLLPAAGCGAASAGGYVPLIRDPPPPRGYRSFPQDSSVPQGLAMTHVEPRGMRRPLPDKSAAYTARVASRRAAGDPTARRLRGAEV